MNEVFSIQAPQMVDCWTFLRNSSFEDNEATRRGIERALVLGAINLWNARRRDNIWRSDKEYTAIWYADFGTSGNSEYRSGQLPKEHLDGLPATDRITGKAWTALVLSIEDRELWDGTLDYRLYDDITDNFFAPLIEQFGLVMYETLRMEGMRGFFDFRATPVVVLTPSQVLVMNEVWQQDGNVPAGLSNVVAVDIVVDEPDKPRFFPAGESLANIREPEQAKRRVFGAF